MHFFPISENPNFMDMGHVPKKKWPQSWKKILLRDNLTIL
jgi:hypothetical protein